MPLQRKVILVVMFSSGIFIMICTILRAHYSLGNITNLPIALGWADRECFVAAIVASLPGIKPLFRNMHWLGSSNPKGYQSSFHNSSGYNHFGSRTSGKTKTFISSRRRSGSNARNFEMDSVTPRTEESRLSSGESEKYILEGTKGVTTTTSPALGDAADHEPLAIHVTTEYSLHHEQGTPANPPRSSME